MDLKKPVEKAKEILKKIVEMFSGVRNLLPNKAMLGKVQDFFRSIFRKGDKAQNKTQETDKTSGYEPPGHKSKSGRFAIRGASAEKHFDKITNFMASLEDRYLHRFPEEKRRLILLGFFGAGVLFIVLLISTIVTFSGSSKSDAPPETSAGFVIPSDELLIHSEPDFLPEFFLERQPRGFWTLEDIRQFWRIPENTELWRDQVKTAVDRLMEGVR